MKSTAYAKMILDTRYKKQNAATYPVRLRITFERKTKYYPTKFSLTENEWKKMQNKRAAFMEKEKTEIENIETRAKEIIKKIPAFSFELFDKRYSDKHDSKSLEGAFNSYINELREGGQIGTAITYECARNSFASFKPGINLIEVNKRFLEQYETFMVKKSTTTISMYLRSLRKIINRAIEADDFSADLYPFKGFEIPEEKNTKKALTIKEIGDIYNYSGEHEKARDFWFFMYLSNGMNVKDMCLLNYKNKSGDKISFERSKTMKTKKEKKKIVIRLTDDHLRIIAKYGNPNKGDNYIFPVLNGDESPEREKQLIQQFTHLINDHMKEVAKEVGIDTEDKACTTYYARHSFATVLKRSGASTEMISEMLGHSDLKTTQKYLDSFEDDQVKQKLEALTGFKTKLKAVS